MLSYDLTVPLRLTAKIPVYIRTEGVLNDVEVIIDSHHSQDLLSIRHNVGDLLVA